MTLRTRLLATMFATVTIVGVGAASPAAAAFDDITNGEPPCWTHGECPAPDGDDPEEDPEETPEDPDVEVESGVARPVSTEPSFTG